MNEHGNNGYDPWDDDYEQGNQPLTKTQYKLAYILLANGEYLETTVWLGEEGMSPFLEAQLFCDYHDLVLIDLEPIYNQSLDFGDYN